jgi:predicted TIM-barrel fold metal-dependent hydrolase
MQQRDPNGHAVTIDDARFTPIFRFLEQRGVIVLGHLGEPRNAWLPLESMTIRGDREYFTAHPQYHMFAHPEWPSYEDQIAARNRMLDQHPKLHFVALHLASLEWSVDRIDEFLKRYPNASVDLAARLVHLKLQASADRDKVRKFFIANQDRILYATDLTRTPEHTDEAFADEAHTVWQDDWRFLALDQEMHSEEFAPPFRGLALPREVVNKIYGANARRMFPKAWK